jgi:hypothetical protein
LWRSVVSPGADRTTIDSAPWKATGFLASKAASKLIGEPFKWSVDESSVKNEVAVTILAESI